MQVKKGEAQASKEKTQKLGDVAAGSVVRFSEFTFEEVISDKDEASFYMKVPNDSPNPQQVMLVSLDGKLVIKRDADRQVVVHKAEVSVFPSEG